MQITAVELENIKNYEAGSFALGPGITAIHGPNGSGKTTILEAISWALFDYLAYKKEDFLKRGAKKGSVRVSFESSLDGREYTVYRDTANGYYIYDPVTKFKLVEQKSQVAGWLKQHMGVEPSTDLRSLFTSAIGVPQGTFTVDFAEQPAKRKVEFDRVLRVDEYQRSADDLISLVRFVESRLTELREDIARLEVQVAALDDFIAERHRIETETRALSAQLPVAERERDEARRKLEELDILCREIERLTQDKSVLAVRIGENEERLIVLARQVELAVAASKEVEAAAPGFAAYTDACERLSLLEKRAEERQTLKSEIDSRRRELITIEAAIQNLGEKLAHVERDKELLADLLPLIGEQEKLEKKRSRLLNFAGEVKEMRERKKGLETELETLRGEYRSLAKRIEECESLKTQAEAVPVLIEQRATLDAALQDKKLQLERTSERRSELARATEGIGHLRERIAPIENGIATALGTQQVVAAIPHLEQDDRRLTEEIARIQASIELDRRTLAEAKDGLCPLLSEKCLNMKDGQGLDQFFSVQIASDQDRLASLLKEREGVQHNLTEARAALPSYSGLETLRTQLLRYQQDLDSQIRHALELEELISKSTVSDQTIGGLRAELDQRTSELEAAQSARAKYEAVVAYKDRYERLVKEGKDKKNVLDRLNTRISRFRRVDDELVEVDKKLEVLCDPRGRALGPKASVAKEAELRTGLEQAERQRGSLDAVIVELERRLEAYSALDAEIAAQRERRTDNERDYRVYLENEPIAGLLPARSGEYEALKATNATDNGRHAAIGQELDAARSRYSAEEHHEARSVLEERIQRCSALVFQMKSLEERLSAIVRTIDDMTEARKRLETLLQGRERGEEVLSVVELIRDSLKKAGPYITDAHLQSISVEANQLYRDITGNPMVTLRWDPGYEIILEEDGYDRPFANLSGGEQMAAALSVRLALLKELSEMRIAFFDEPTTNMDEERRRNLAEQIGRIKDFDQLFVISHDDSFEGFTDQVIALGDGTGESKSEAGIGPTSGRLF
jgi:exonuclease SbcC